MQAGVAELKARLSSYLKRVKAGHEVVVTERGVPVAKMVPLGGSEHRASRRDRLARAGVLQPGEGRVGRRLKSPPGGPSVGRGVLEALLAERDEGR